MARFLTPHVVELLLWLAVLVVLLVVARGVLRRIRAASLQQEPSASELILKLRESQRQGELSDAEFRTIKTNLAQQLQDELRDDGGTG